MASKNPNDYISCPYNKSHLIMRGRLIKHLERCGRNASNSKEYFDCPFNATHIITQDEREEHLKICEDRATLEKFLHGDKKRPVSSTPCLPPVSVECEENWDNEPDAPTYDPAAHCEQKLIVRCLQGQSRAVRKTFRNSERLRFSQEK